MNYAGHPFVSSIHENKLLYRSLVVSGWFWLILVVGIIPGLAELLEMVAIPLPLQGKMCYLAMIDMVVTYGCEWGLKRMFPAPLPPLKGYMVHKRELKQLELAKKQF